MTQRAQLRSTTLAQLVCCLTLMAIVVAILPASAHALSAGAAKMEITPPLGTPLNGRENRLGLGAQSIHDPLWVRALYLDDDNTAIFIVTADLYEFSPALHDRILELCPVDLPDAHVFLVATGTHNAPGGMDQALAKRVVSGRFMPDLVEDTARQFAEAMRAAFDQRRRGTIGAAITTQAVLSKNAYRDDGPRIDRIGVVRVDDADGVPIAILGNFAALPDTLGPDFQFAVSADFPGVFCTALEDLSSSDSGMVAMYLPGAAADQIIVDPENHSGWDRTATVGNLLAVRVKSLANAIVGRDVNLTVRASRVPLPEPNAPGFLPTDTQVRLLTIDRVDILFLAGIPDATIGLASNERIESVNHRAAFTVASTGIGLGYTASPASYADAYGPRWGNYFGPGYARWLDTAVTQLLDGSPPKSRPADLQRGDHELRLEGDPYARGLALGQNNDEAIRAAYVSHVATTLMFSEDHVPYTWSLVPRAVDRRPLIVPRAMAAQRPLLRGIGTEVVEELLGIADGAGLHFDAFWSLHALPPPVPAPQLIAAEASPFTGLLGAVWRFPAASSPRIRYNRPDNGAEYIELLWGVEGRGLAGIGPELAACILPADPPPGATPSHIVLRQILAAGLSPRETLDTISGDVVHSVEEIFMAARRTPEWMVLAKTGAREPFRSYGNAVFASPPVEKAAANADELADYLVQRIRNDATNLGPDREYAAVIFQPSRRSATFTFTDAKGEPTAERTISVQP